MSVRVDRSVNERLNTIRRDEGKSFGDLLREAVGVQEATANSFDEGLELGLSEGWADAERRYRIRYRCARCGRWMDVSSEQEKAAAQACMEARGWHHESCPMTD